MREWTGRDTLLTLIGTFAVIFAVNGYFIYVALATYPGEDVRHPYLQGAEFNQTITDRVKQAELGWKATIGADRRADGTVDVRVTLADKSGKPVTDEALEGTLRHPMNEQLDRPVGLKEVAAGVYEGVVKAVSPGAWDVVAMRKSSAEVPFEAERRVFLK